MKNGEDYDLWAHVVAGKLKVTFVGLKKILYGKVSIGLFIKNIKNIQAFR